MPVWKGISLGGLRSPTCAPSASSASSPNAHLPVRPCRVKSRTASPGALRQPQPGRARQTAVRRRSFEHHPGPAPASPPRRPSRRPAGRPPPRPPRPSAERLARGGAAPARCARSRGRAGRLTARTPSSPAQPCRWRHRDLPVWCRGTPDPRIPNPESRIPGSGERQTLPYPIPASLILSCLRASFTRHLSVPTGMPSIPAMSL